MREIKFRALKDDISDCRFYYGSLIYDKNGNPRIHDVDTDLFHTCLKGTESQYTGLKDKNGKEIYEGDIVFWDYDKIVVSYGIQGVDAFEGVGFNLWGHYGQKQDGTRIQSEIEVIGNIYETTNP